MPACSAYGCANNSGINRNVGYYTFPDRDKNRHVYNKWVAAMKRENFVPTKNARVCGIHFKESDFNESDVIKIRIMKNEKFKSPRLKDNVVPSTFLGLEEKLPKKRKSKFFKRKKVLQLVDNSVSNSQQESKTTLVSDSLHVKMIDAEIQCRLGTEIFSAINSANVSQSLTDEEGESSVVNDEDCKLNEYLRESSEDGEDDDLDLTVKVNNNNCEMDVKVEIKEETSKVGTDNVKGLDSSALEMEDHDKLSVSSDECEMPVKVEVKEEPWWNEKEAEIECETEAPSISDEKKDGTDDSFSHAESPRFYTEEHVDDVHENDAREISYAEWAVAMLGSEQSDECEQNGNSAFYLKSQSGRKKGKKQHICKICGKQFTQTPNLKMHYLIHEGKRPHKCNICGKSFTKRSTMKAHTLIHEGKKPYKCDTCGKSLTTRSNLKAHKLLHEDRMPPKCDICEMSFPSKSALKRHNLIHEGKCKICEKVFTESSHLIAHSAIHEGEKPHKCYICEESFRKRSDLKIHILIHEGKNLHKCDICGKLFTKRYYLKIHYMVHEGKRPHKCNVCERSFTAISNLRAHKVIHEGIKPHKCEICDKRFAVKPTLKRHYMTHEEIKCDICDQNFPAKSALKLHYLTHEERSPQNCEILRRALLGDQT